jgi:hypothetical protein
MVTVVVRVDMPDRPGALGQVASRIGAVRGDVLGIEILEQGVDRVVDELTVTLPDIDLVPLLIAEIDSVDGVSAEDVRAVPDDRTDPNLAALAAGAALAECEPDERLKVLCEAVRRVIDADWVVVLRDDEVIDALGETPEIGWLLAFLAGSDHLDEVDPTLPGELVWGHLLSARLTVAAGRHERRIHERERVRVSLLGRLADALIAVDASDG